MLKASVDQQVAEVLSSHLDLGIFVEGKKTVIVQNSVSQ